MVSMKKKIIGIFIIICCILLSGHYLSTVISSFRSYIYLIIGIIIFIPVCVKFGRGLFFLKTSSEKFVALFSCCAIFSMVANFEIRAWFSYYIYIATLLFALFIVKKYSFDQFKKAFLVTLTMVSVISLVMAILQFNGIYLSFGTVENTNGVLYANNYIYTYNASEYAVYRNYGCFWEPGLFTSILLYGIILEGTNQKKCIFRIVLFGITVLTTLSAAGYVLLLPTVLVAVVNGNRSKKVNIIWNVVALVLCMLTLLFSSLIITFISQTIPIVGDKLFINNELAIQTSRIESIYRNYQIFLQSPIFGNGIYGANTSYSFGIAQTSTFGYMLSAYGILGVSYIAAWILAINRCPNSGFWGKVFLMFTLFSILNKEPHTYILVSWIILFYFLDSTSLPKAWETH